MVYRKTKSVRIIPSALIGLFVALVLSSGATAGPYQIAMLHTPSIETSSKNFDLDALETKIRNTDAINFFAKIELKIGIDSLINDFGQFHNGQSGASLRVLKARFEKFLRSTVAMLRKGDASLAEELVMSRDELWKTLNNPTKLFAIVSLDHPNGQD